jgi:hypothetical protein
MWEGACAPRRSSVTYSKRENQEGGDQAALLLFSGSLGLFLVPKLHLGTHLSWQLDCPCHRPIS